MPRKGPVAKRDVLPDPIYNSKLVTRLINKIWLMVKEVNHKKFFTLHLILFKERTGNEPMEVFDQALKNIMPVLRS